MVFFVLASFLEPDRKFSAIEKRELITIADINFRQDIPSQLDDYFNDQAFMKDNFYMLYTRFKLFFGESISDDVTVGKNKWFYLGSPYSKKFPNLISHSNQPLYKSESHVNNYINQKLTFKNFLKDKGIKYLFVIAPDKSTIYPEYLPDYAQDYQYKKSIFSEKVSKKLLSVLGDSFLNLRDPLLKAKENNPHFLYYLWDTHWNKRGANIAQAYITNRIAAKFPEQTLNSNFFNLKITTNKINGDLAQFIGASHLKENTLYINSASPEISKCEKIDARGGPNPEVVVFYERVDYKCISSASSLKVLLIRDSFSNDLIPYLSRRYGELFIVFEKPSLSRLEELITKIKPDIVVEQIVERDFLYSF
tara:strand:+ start:74 stop:1165 length:1092 start_codon:yes stop_codon:yes gene_type:complete